MTQENTGSLDAVEKTLEKTDIGHFINHHKNSVLIVFIVIFLAVVGYSFYRHKQNESSIQDLSAIYSFKNNYILPFVEGKITFDEFNGKFNGLTNDIKGDPNFLISLMTVIQKLEETNMGKEAFTIVDETIKFLNTSNYLYVFWAMKYASLAEDHGDTKKAIESLEKVLTQKSEIARAQVYLQLGRLYKNLGDKDKAKANFKFVVEKFPNDSAVKLAKYYLDEI